MSCKSDCTDSTSGHFRRIAPHALRTAWLDPQRRVIDIAAEFGLSPRALRCRVKLMGLPVRSQATKRPHITPTQEPLFVAAWQARVSIADMAEHFDVDCRTVSNTVRRLGLQPRIPGTKPKATMRMLLSDLAQARLSGLMRRAAQIEQSAIINAEMADYVSPRRMVGAQIVQGAV